MANGSKWVVERVELEGSDDWGLSVCAGGGVVCDLYEHQGSSYERFGGDEANARLIAAAPEMYAYIIERAEAGDSKAMRIVMRHFGLHGPKQ